MSDVSPVLFDQIAVGKGVSIGIVVLNAPKSLNALTLAMVQMMLPQLQAWQADNSVVAVIVRGAGDRAFCAGGDVVQMRQSAMVQDGMAETFFEQEYRLDYLAHTYHKPLLVWGHGIVMGGGLGLLAGASHRIVTPQTRIAMPEVTIGLFPDVGATWFLNRMPGRCGLFLALTGAVINATDSLDLGLADVCVQHDQWQEVIDRLCQIDWQEPDQHHCRISAMLAELNVAADCRPRAQLGPHQPLIESMTDASDWRQIVSHILAYCGDNEWMLKAVDTLAHGCPTTLGLVFEQLLRGRSMTLKQCFQMELVLAVNCLRFVNFREGVRALLVDKDRQPQFSPSRLEDVSRDWIEQHFTPPWNGNSPLEDL